MIYLLRIFEKCLGGKVTTLYTSTLNLRPTPPTAIRAKTPRLLQPEMNHNIDKNAFLFSVLYRLSKYSEVVTSFIL